MICGHIHHATIRDIADVRYINCGDWVESCTAIAEHHDGTFEIIVWDEVRPEPLAETARGPDLQDASIQPAAAA